MYVRTAPIPIKSSASLLCNNFDALMSEEEDEMLYGVVHKSCVWLFNPKRVLAPKQPDNTLIYKQVVCKGEGVHASSMILQAKWCILPQRTLLVIASVKGVQMFEPDGSVMVFWQALAPNPEEGVAQYARGISAAGENHICIGIADGVVLVFVIPNKGTAVKMQETLTDHLGSSIADIYSDRDLVATTDDSGKIILWRAGGHFKKLCTIEGQGYPCSSIRLWEGKIIAAYGTGHIRVFSESGTMLAEVCAHARWINAIDICPDTGLLLSVSEDTYVRVWKMTSNPFDIEMSYQFVVENLQLTGGKFLDSEGNSFGVTGYDSNDVHIFKRT